MIVACGVLVLFLLLAGAWLDSGARKCEQCGQGKSEFSLAGKDVCEDCWSEYWHQQSSFQIERN